MARNLVVLLPLLLLAVRVAVVFGNPECATGLEPNTDRNGGDLSGPNGPANKKDSAVLCCDSCVDNKDCVAFTWNKNNKNCWLKGPVPPPPTPNSAGVSKRIVPDECLAGLEIKTDRPGGDMDIPGNGAGLATTRPDLCCAKCVNTPGCKGFTWNTVSGWCWLKGPSVPNAQPNEQGISKKLSCDVSSSFFPST